MDDSDCMPRRVVPRISVPFGGHTNLKFGGFHSDNVTTGFLEHEPRQRGSVTHPHQAPCGVTQPLSTPRGGVTPSLPTPPRGVTPLPTLASSPPSTDRFLDDSLLCLSPGEKFGSQITPSQWNDEKENCEERGDGQSHQLGHDGRARSNNETHNLEFLSSGMQNMTVTQSKKHRDTVIDKKTLQSAAVVKKTLQNDAAHKKTVQFASPSIKSASPKDDRVKMYVHGIPGGGTKNSSVTPSVILKTQKSIPSKTLQTQNFKTASVSKPESVKLSSSSLRTRTKSPTALSSSSKGFSNNHSCSSSFRSATAKNDVSVSSCRSHSSTAAPSVTSVRSTTSARSATSSSARSTTSTASVPSSRPEPNSILRLSKSSAAADAERSFDSVAAAEDLVQRDSVVRKTVQSKVAQRTNVPKDKKVFSNLVPLADLNDVDQALEDEISSKRRMRKKPTRGGGSSSTRSSQSGRRNSDTELADRLEPDIRDFWNPEWEIGRPDWSLPFKAEDIIVGESDADKLALERCADMTYLVKRIREDHERELRAKDVSRIFFGK